MSTIRHMKGNLQNILSRSIPLLLVIGIVVGVILFGKYEQFSFLWEGVKKISLEVFVVFVLLSFINFCIYTKKWQATLVGEKNIKFMTLLGYRFFAYAVNYVTPSQVGGEPLRMYLLEQQGIERSKAISSVLIDKISEFLVFVFFAVAAVMLGSTRGMLGHMEVILILVALVTILIYYIGALVRGECPCWNLCHMVIKKRFFLANIMNKLKEVELMMGKCIVENRENTYRILFYGVLGFLFIMAEYALLLHFFNQDISTSVLLILSALPMLGYATPTPGAAVGLEVAQWTAFSMAGLDVSYVLPTVLLLRSRDMLFVVIGLLYGSAQGLSMILKKKEDSEVAP